MTEDVAAEPARESDNPDWDTFIDVIAGIDVWVVFGAFTIPFVLGVVDSRLMTPLGAPGYVLFVAMTVVGDRVIPQFAFWLYWIPFFGTTYVLSICLAWGGRQLRTTL